MSAPQTLALAFASLAILHASTARSEAEALDEPAKTAHAYLDALQGRGDPAARAHLLGGVPLAAREFRIPNWSIVAREAPRKERASVQALRSRFTAVDKAGQKALAAATGAKTSAVDRAQAREALLAARQEAASLAQAHPVFAYIARVDKDVFWHPQNPWRQVLRELGASGEASVELHLFRIEERDEGRPPRVWPLRVLRIKSDAGYDSGWKVLPASHWDPEY